MEVLPLGRERRASIPAALRAPVGMLTIGRSYRANLLGVPSSRDNLVTRPPVTFPSPSTSPDSRVAELQLRLLDETDPKVRARVHLELARIAVRDGQLGPAVRQLNETLRFDASSAAARQLLEDLGQPIHERPRMQGLRQRVLGLIRIARGNPPEER